MTRFKAMVVEETEDGRFLRSIKDTSIDDLPAGDVLIQVRYSSLNYKDALSATGHKGITRRYPHTPGIDAAGIVEHSQDKAFRSGDEVIVTGYDLGMNTAGGFGRFIRVPAAWVMPRPAGLSLRECMIYGTAGFTAGLSVHRLQQHGVAPDQGDILVTGASGGVGGIAVALLAKIGYRVTSATGKNDAQPYLRNLGAAAVLSREEVIDTGGKALSPPRWAGAVDTVGGDMLVSAIKATRYGGAVTCCGMVASTDLSTSIYPFILRGIGLLGIASAECPMDARLQIWNRLSNEWKLDKLEALVSERGLDELDREIDRILQGQIKGRIVINLND